LEHKVISSSAPRPLANYSEAFVIGDLVFAAGQLASDFKHGVPAQARTSESFPYYGSNIELQTAYILENLKRTFEAAGSSLDHALKAQVFLTSLEDFHGFDRVWNRTFNVPPPRTSASFPYYASNIELQTAYVLENLKNTFEAAGSSLDRVPKAQVFLTDLNNFHGFDSVWKRYFAVPPPRTTIGCTGLLVKDTLVEIDLIGYRSGRGLEHQVVKSAAPRPLAHYSEGFTLGSHVFAAGQIASDYRTGVPPE